MKLRELKTHINETLQKKYLQPEKVLGALGVFSRNFEEGLYDSFIKAVCGRFLTYGSHGDGLDEVYDSLLSKAFKLISEDTMRERLQRELPEASKRVPLGVVMHIGAGNMPGLGAFSVIEGLICGNINILKPAAGDSSFSGFILRELVRIEPELKPYIYMFDIPSGSAGARRKLRKLITVSDAVSVWGGDEAIRTVRRLAGPEKRLIEWGHKFSFVYITEKGLKDTKSLSELTRHISMTRMRLCSSCQTVYIEAKNSDELLRDIQYIKRMCKTDRDPLGHNAAETIINYTDRLLSDINTCGWEREARLLNCPVKIASGENILRDLRALPYSLQTAGLICADEEKAELSEMLIKAGAHRVRRPAEMSEYISGEYHDGRAPLYEYTRMAEISSI